MASNIRKGRNVVYSLSVHLVFVTKYRRRVITQRVRERLRTIFASVCDDYGAHLREMDGEEDHVHLLVDYPPKHSISRLVMSLKLVSCRLLKNENYPEIERVLYGPHLWTPSYYAGSTGGATLDTVKAYIQNQRADAPKASDEG
jgi:putative transposase